MHTARVYAMLQKNLKMMTSQLVGNINTLKLSVVQSTLELRNCLHSSWLSISGTVFPRVGIGIWVGSVGTVSWRMVGNVELE